ncbi:hypothetical protein ScPMuIL_001313 [Solemya velum]
MDNSRFTRGLTPLKKMAIRTLIPASLPIGHNITSHQTTNLTDSMGQIETSSSETSIPLSRHRRASWDRSKKGYTFEEKRTIIDIHNGYRSSVGSSYMRALTWDTELETFAQSVAENCNFEHSGVVSIGEWSQVGENLYAAKSLDAAKPIDIWFDEYKHYNYETLKCAKGKQCGHYTQMIWADTKKVGCGVSFCPELLNTKATNMWFAVCEYGPVGNWPGTSPYEDLWGVPCFPSCPIDQPVCDERLRICVDPYCNFKRCRNGGVLVTSVCMCDCTNTSYTGEFCDLSRTEDTEQPDGTSHIRDEEFFEFWKGFLDWVSDAMARNIESEDTTAEHDENEAED